jgi:hypothetical protein
LTGAQRLFVGMAHDFDHIHTVFPHPSRNMLRSRFDQHLSKLGRQLGTTAFEIMSVGLAQGNNRWPLVPGWPFSAFWCGGVGHRLGGRRRLCSRRDCLADAPDDLRVTKRRNDINSKSLELIHDRNPVAQFIRRNAVFFEFGGGGAAIYELAPEFIDRAAVA